jgi:hypothetical protein
LAAFREFDRRLREHLGGKRYLLGVIPDRCTIDDVLFLRDETDCVIGMHGTDHDEARLDRNGGNQFEPWLTVTQIREELLSRHVSLQEAVGRKVQVYMPPRNVIDGRTYAALLNSPMVWITSGPETNPDMVRGSSRFIYSMSPLEYGRTDELLQRNAHMHLIGEGKDRDVVLTLHWTWETNIGLEHMRCFFDQIPKDLFEDFDG